MSYQNHAWKHRPKAFGGTDPVDIGLPWINAWYDGSSQSVTSSGSVELRLDFHQTFASEVFELDTTSTANPSGILIKQRCLCAMFFFIAGSTTPKGVYLETQPATSFPTFGSEDDPETSANGTPFLFNEERLDNTERTLSGIYLRKMFPTGGVPWRTILAANVPTSEADYIVTLSSLTIVRLARF